MALSKAQRRGGTERVRVIIRTKKDKLAGVKSLLRKQGYNVSREFSLIAGVAIEVPVKFLDVLSKIADIEMVSSDAAVGGTADLSSTAEYDYGRNLLQTLALPTRY